jgi:hypothetical protein
VTSETRADKALLYPGTMIKRSGALWLVQSESDNRIWHKVRLGPDNCTCIDWQMRKPAGGCKHIIAVAARLQNVQ